MDRLAHTQFLLTRLYGLAERSGLSHQAWFRFVFQSFYFLYKSRLEDPFLRFGKRYPHLLRRGHILDIGANIGYTAWVFTQFMSPEFKLFAFEPDEDNFSQLTTVCKRYGLNDRVVTVAKAVGAFDGFAELWVNRNHHGDHRVITDSFSDLLSDKDERRTVPIVTIDGYLSERPDINPVAFIKIDVQGYEKLVCDGMQATLQQHPDVVVAFEYGPSESINLGFDPDATLKFFAEREFKLYRLSFDGTLTPIVLTTIKNDIPKSGYFDIIAARGDLFC